MTNERASLSRIVLGLLCGVTAIWLIAPMLIVIPMSFTSEQSFQFPPTGWSTRWYAHLLHSKAWYGSLETSIEIATLVAAVATTLGTAAAFAIARGRLRARGLVHALLIAPMIIPVVVGAIGIYEVFLRWRLTGTTLGFVAAHTSLAIPFVVVTVLASLATFEATLERAAASLGAAPLQTLRKVTIPLILPGLLSGALFAFMTSFDEVVVSLFLVTPSKRTVPVQMFSSVTREIDPTIAAASTTIFIATTAALSGLMFLALRRRATHA
jgi:putative spermidine/putrescine transport system permease protein